jgi:hypothetical protein
LKGKKKKKKVEDTQGEIQKNTLQALGGVAN